MSLHDDHRWQGALSRTGNTQSPDPFPQLSSPGRLAWPLTPPPGYAESEATGIASSTPLPQGMFTTYLNDTEESGHPTPTLEPYPASRAFLPTSRRLPTPHPGPATLPRLNEHSGQSTPQLSLNQSSNRPIAGEGIPPPNQWPYTGRPVYQPSRQGQTSSWGWSPVNIEPRPSPAQNSYNYGYNNAHPASNATFASNPSTSHLTFDHTFHRGQPAPSVTFPKPSTVPYAHNYQPNNSSIAGRGQNVWTYQTQPVPPSWGAQGSTPYWTQSEPPPSTQPAPSIWGTQGPTPLWTRSVPSPEQSVHYPAPSDHQTSVHQPSAPGPYNPVSGNRPTRDLPMPSWYLAPAPESKNARQGIQISLQANDMGNNSGVSLDLLKSGKANLRKGNDRLLKSEVGENGYIKLSFEWPGYDTQSGYIQVGDATVNELAAKVAKFVCDRFLNLQKATKWRIGWCGKAKIEVERFGISYLEYLGGIEWRPVITHEDCS